MNRVVEKPRRIVVAVGPLRAMTSGATSRSCSCAGGVAGSPPCRSCRSASPLPGRCLNSGALGPWALSVIRTLAVAVRWTDRLTITACQLRHSFAAGLRRTGTDMAGI